MSLLFVYETSGQTLEGINKKCIITLNKILLYNTNFSSRQSFVEKGILAREVDIWNQEVRSTQNYIWHSESFVV